MKLSSVHDLCSPYPHPDTHRCMMRNCRDYRTAVPRIGDNCTTILICSTGYILLIYFTVPLWQLLFYCSAAWLPLAVTYSGCVGMHDFRAGWYVISLHWRRVANSRLRTNRLSGMCVMLHHRPCREEYLITIQLVRSLLCMRRKETPPHYTIQFIIDCMHYLDNAKCSQPMITSELHLSTYVHKCPFVRGNGVLAKFILSWAGPITPKYAVVNYCVAAFLSHCIVRSEIAWRELP
jgi:hypothetical protein